MICLATCSSRSEKEKPDSLSQKAPPPNTILATIPSTLSNTKPSLSVLPGSPLNPKKQAARKIFSRDGEVSKEYRIDGSAPGDTLIFGNFLDHAQVSYFFPILFFPDSRGWSMISFEKEFSGYSWQFVGYFPESKRILAIFDFAVEGPGWELEFLASDDFARSWFHTGTLKKPSYTSMFHNVRLESNGTLWITLFQEEESSGAKIGFYEYKSQDIGKTWKLSKFSAVTGHPGVSRPPSQEIKSEADLSKTP